MPIHNRHFVQAGGLPNPAALVAAGPLLQVELHVPTVLAAAMTAQGQPVPTPVPGWGLIDTGATQTAVHRDVPPRLGVNPVGVTTSGTAGGPQQHSLFPVRISTPGVGLDVEFAAVAGVDLTGQIVAGHPIIALIGRDVLGACVLTYNGPGGFFTLAW